MKITVLFVLLYSTLTFAKSLPQNDLWISADSISPNDITRLTKKEFDWAIKKVSDFYVPYVADMGKSLTIFHDWDDGTVNAYADRKGDHYEVHLYGGLARFKNLSADGFMMVICHELGHNIGGLPKYRSVFDESHNWAVNEGQSDYFAALKCMRNVLVLEDNLAYVKTIKVDAYATEMCTAQFQNIDDVALCERIAMAGKSVSMVFQIVSGSERELMFDEPSTTRVLMTKHSHPKPQCRLDTFFQAALCPINHEESVSEKDINKGVCSQGVGSRPRCWYKP